MVWYSRVGGQKSSDQVAVILKGEMSYCDLGQITDLKTSSHGSMIVMLDQVIDSVNDTVYQQVYSGWSTTSCNDMNGFD